MTQEQTRDLFRRIKAQYGERFQKVTQEVFDVWYDCLKDLDADMATTAVNDFAKASVYPPTIADIVTRHNAILEEHNALKKTVIQEFELVSGHYPGGADKDAYSAFYGVLRAHPKSEWLSLTGLICRKADAYIRHCEKKGSNAMGLTEFINRLDREVINGAAS